MNKAVFAAALFVGCGGFFGSIMRYGLSLIPFKGDFPLMTFLTNLLGAVLIGVVVEVTSGIMACPPSLVLFLKTGLCGGFTTFSTFSLETLSLFENSQTKTAVVYMSLSLAGCVLGVLIGKMLGKSILTLCRCM